MPSEIKEKVVAALAEDLKGITHLVVTQYQGLTAEEFDSLRNAIRPLGAKYTVVKNRLAKIAFEQNGFGSMKDYMKGPTAIAYKGSDVAALAKVLFKFSDEHPNFKVRAGYVFGNATDPSSLKAIANLPSKEVLLATLLARLQSPLTKLAATLNEPLRSLHASLTAVAKKKEATAA
jgi:large subunit ribosomal protein L10